MANSFIFRKVRKRHRLTDIETKEVSLVDKGANKRKFAVIKSDTETNEMAKLNAEVTLEKVTTGLTKLAELTETIKTFVEKSEAGVAMPAEDWSKAIQSFEPWMDEVLTTLGYETVTEPATTTETPAVVEPKVEEKPAETVVAAPVTTETKPAETVATAPATETVVTPSVAETVTTTAAPTPAEVLYGLAKSVAALSATPSAAEIEKALAGYEGLYISGGLYIDSYDIEALAMVCNAICAAMGSPEDMAKSADKVIAEVNKRTAAVAKRVGETTKTNDTDGKELRVASMLLKSLKESIAKAETAKPVTATSVVDTAAIQKMINDAIAPLVAETVSLKQQVAKVEAEKIEVTKKLNAALATPATRASSTEQVTKPEPTTSAVRVNRNGVTDYNETN